MIILWAVVSNKASLFIYTSRCWFIIHKTKVKKKKRKEKRKNEKESNKIALSGSFTLNKSDFSAYKTNNQ